MRVAFVCNEYPPMPQGGIGTFVKIMSGAMVAQGLDVTVVGLGEKEETLYDGSVRIISLQQFGLQQPNDRDRACLAHFLDQGDFDIVEVPDYGGMLPSNLKNCPKVLVRLHNTHTSIAIASRRLPNLKLAYNEWKTLKTHRHWIGVSQYILQRTKKIFCLKPTINEIIYNPAPIVVISEDRVQKIREIYGDFVVSVGKLIPTKGVLSLARAAEYFLSRHASLKIVYVGADIQFRSGWTSQAILKLIREEFRERVVFIGRVSHEETLSYIKAARLLVQPSYFEAFSMVPLEAFSLGTPVIYTNRTSGPEAVEHEKTGLLVNPNKPKSIAGAINRLLFDSDLRSEFVNNASKKVANEFSVPVILQKTLEAYQL